MDDAGFLEAIRRAPDDPAPRLIYADLLDEAGDPRAALIRVEEEMRSLPPARSRYWLLRPQRDRLKLDAPADWMHEMGYDLPHPVFRHGWPDDPKARWRVIRAFAEQWYGVQMGDFGDISPWVASQKRWAREYPPALKEFATVNLRLGLAGRHYLSPQPIRAIRVPDPDPRGCRPGTAGRWEVTFHDRPAPGQHLCDIAHRFAPTRPNVDDGSREWPLDEFLRDELLTCADGDRLEVEVFGHDLMPAIAAGFGPMFAWRPRRDPLVGGAPPSGGYLVGERPGLLLIVKARSHAVGIRLLASPILDRWRVPAWVWPLCRREGTFGGMFAGERRRAGG